MLKNEGLLSVKEWKKADLVSFFSTVQKNRSTPLKSSPVGILGFFEASTRTRLSFEKAGLDLGIRWISLSEGDLSLKKGETLADTFQTIACYEPDFFVIRHAVSYFPHFVNRWTQKPVINAGDGQNEHPTQALLDGYTLWNRNPQKKWKICFFGDVIRSRVARSDLAVFKALGYSVSVVDDRTGETHLFAKAYSLSLVARPKLKDFDVIYCLRVQAERGSQYTLSPVSFRDLGKKTLIMHPGPVIQGKDIEKDLCDFDADRSLIRDQVRAGYMVRRELLAQLTRGKK